MLTPGFVAIKAGQSIVAPSIGYRSNGTDNTSQATYSFASKAIGSAAADRYVYVACCTRNVFSSCTCTIAGNSATPIASFASGVSSGQQIHFFGLNVATGTTATIAYTLNTADSDGSVVVWSGTGFANPLEPYSKFDYVEASPATNLYSGGIWAPQNSVVLAVRQSALTAGTPSCTWTGLTEVLDVAYESNLQCTTAASATLTGFGDGVSFSANMVGTLGVSRMSAIVLF